MKPGHQRIYHFHVPKTAGSSLNVAFWTLGGLKGLDTREMSTGTGVTGNGLKFVAYSRALIEGGDYFFATSHYPAWWIKVPQDIFTVTILRDPGSRLISYYRNLLWARTNQGNPTASDTEPFIEEVVDQSAFIDGGLRYALGQLSPHGLRFERRAIRSLGFWQFLMRLAPRRRESAFRDFLARIPPRYLLTQLHMFSERFDPTEAAENALACSAVCFTESFGEDLAKLAGTLELDLKEKHERRFSYKVILTDSEFEILRERLAPEYEMIEQVRAALE